MKRKDRQCNDRGHYTNNSNVCTSHTIQASQCLACAPITGKKMKKPVSQRRCNAKRNQSHILEVLHPFLLKMLKEGRSEAGDFFKLLGQMRHPAIVKLVGDLREVELIIKKQFLHAFDLVDNDELLYGNSFNF